MEENYLIYGEPSSVDAIQLLEDSLFNMESFHFDRDLLSYPFRKRFDYHYFLDINHLFYKEKDYAVLISFLKLTESGSFILSAPYYALLYPIEVSVNCPANVYANIPNYSVPEIKWHIRNGVGFRGIPHRFMFDRSRDWALYYDDSYQFITIGVQEVANKSFQQSFEQVDVLTSSEILRLIERYGGGDLEEQTKLDFLRIYQSNDSITIT